MRTKLKEHVMSKEKPQYITDLLQGRIQRSVKEANALFQIVAKSCVFITLK